MFDGVLGLTALVTGFAATIGAGWRILTQQGPIRAFQGAIKWVYYSLVGLTLIQALWVILVILSLDMLTPPYVIGPETLIAIPLSGLFGDWFSLSPGWALGWAYAAVLAFAAIVVTLHFLWLRHVLKVL